jgi:hypothetical protein
MKPPVSLNLAYLLVASPLPNVFIGGLMVTDRFGLPLEFRYTEPIQPSKIQQVLYGQVLNSYIKKEVILETLLKNIEVSFKALLVEDDALLEIKGKNYSVGRLTLTKSPPIGETGKRQEIAPGELLLQLTAEGNPIRLTLPEGVSTPSPTATTASTPTTSKTGELETPASEDARPARADLPSLLIDAAQSMDIVEPLRRIEKALDIICHEEGLIAANPAGTR